jgi:hypothetical protein
MLWHRYSKNTANYYPADRDPLSNALDKFLAIPLQWTTTGIQYANMRTTVFQTYPCSSMTAPYRKTLWLLLRLAVHRANALHYHAGQAWTLITVDAAVRYLRLAVRLGHYYKSHCLALMVGLTLTRSIMSHAWM